MSFKVTDLETALNVFKEAGEGAWVVVIGCGVSKACPDSTQHTGHFRNGAVDLDSKPQDPDDLKLLRLELIKKLGELGVKVEEPQDEESPQK